MKTEFEELIDRLKEVVDCSCDYCMCGGKEELPILIGDVLEKICQHDDHNSNFEDISAQLIVLWRAIPIKDSFTKSLQEIYAEAEWKEKCVRLTSHKCDQYCIRVLVAKPSPATSLLLFLKELGL